MVYLRKCDFFHSYMVLALTEVNVPIPTNNFLGLIYSHLGDLSTTWKNVIKQQQIVNNNLKFKWYQEHSL